MKTRSKIRERVFTVFFMFTVTFVFISAVSGLHLATRDRVEENAQLHIKRAILLAAGFGMDFSDDEVTKMYEDLVTTAPDGTARFYLVRDTAVGEGLSYVFLREGTGLWGTILAAVAMDRNLSEVVGVSFVEHNETPGLGARISEPWFEDQFKGKRAPLMLMPEGTRSELPNQVDALTGATVTSKGVRDIVNQLFEEAAMITESSNDTEEDRRLQGMKQNWSPPSPAANGEDA